MPVMSGFESTALIRKYEIEHGLQPVPIIALTAHAMVGYRVSSPSYFLSNMQEKCLEAGMNEYLTKPLDKKLLLSMVHKCSTTIPVLHPNLNRIIDVTPDTEIGNPLDNTNWAREARHNNGAHEKEMLDVRGANSRGSLLRGNSGPT